MVNQSKPGFEDGSILRQRSRVASWLVPGGRCYICLIRDSRNLDCRSVARELFRYLAKEEG